MWKYEYRECVRCERNFIHINREHFQALLSEMFPMRIHYLIEVEEGKSVVTVEQKIQQLYDAIFVTEYTGNVYHTILGEYEFDDNSKNFVKSVESMLSVYADYNI